MHSPPVARRHFPWQTMLAAGLFVSGTCFGYAVALVQQPPVLERTGGVQLQFEGDTETSRERSGTAEGIKAEDSVAEGSTAAGGAAEGGTVEGVEVAEAAEAASGCCGPCSSVAPA